MPNNDPEGRILGQDVEFDCIDLNYIVPDHCLFYLLWMCVTLKYLHYVFTEKPYSERNVVYIPIITLSHATSHDFKWRKI